MRDTLTILAGALIVVLTAALVGPWLVDWTAHRGWVESELSRMSGARVQVGGTVDLKLLPVPRLKATNVRVTGIREQGPILEIADIRLELAAASLLRGELRFTDADLDRPRLVLMRPSEGELVIPRLPSFDPSGVQIERLNIRDGALVLRNPGGEPPIVLGGLDLTGEAASLIGPFKGNGQLRIGADPVRFRFSTGQIDDQKMRAKAIVDESAFAPRMDLEGLLSFAAAQTGVTPAFEGLGTFTATSPVAGISVPWRLSGPVLADAQGLRMETADLRAGEEDRALSASGSVALAFGADAKGEARFAARQFDFDRLLAGAKDARPAGEQIVGMVAKLLGDAELGDRFAFPVTLALTSPAANVAGETLTDLQAEIGFTPGDLPRVKWAASGPARASISLEGVLETGPAPAFRGGVDLSVRDLPRFADWLSQSLPGAAARLRDIPFRSVDMLGNVELSSVGVIGRTLSLRLDRSQLSGTMAFSRATGQEPARFFADLMSDALDLDGLPELSGPARLAADMDLSLTLDARAVRVERFGAGFVDAGRIGLRLTREDGALRLERFELENIGGANATARGHMDGQSNELSVEINAARLGELATLLQRVAPGTFANALAQRATVLSPARIGFRFLGGPSQILREMKIEGTARGTRIEALAIPKDEGIEFSGSAESNDPAMLLRQFGLETQPVSGQGAARLSVRAQGSQARGFATTLRLSAARSELVFDGRASGTIEAPVLEGTGNLRAVDVTPLLQVLAIALPESRAGLPVDGSANLAYREGSFAIERLSGTAGGVFINGNLRATRESETLRWAGDIRADRLSLTGLASLAFGPLQQAPRNALWPADRLGRGMSDLPRGEIEMNVGEFDFTENLRGRDARFVLRLAPGLVALEQAQVNVSAGRLGGQLTMRRDGANASLSGRADIADFALSSGPLVALATGHLDFTSTGQSYQALAAGLAGSGQFDLAHVVLNGADVSAIARLIDAADAGGLVIDENEMRTRLSRELDRAPIVVPQIALDASLAAGVLRLAPKNDRQTQLQLSYEIRRMMGGIQLSLASAQAPRDWPGGRPAVVLVWSDRGGTLQRSVEAGPLFQTISARAIAREAARVEALESDIRERASFARQMRGFDFMRRREREVVAFLNEQRRRAEEERAREAGRLPAETAPAPARVMENAPQPVLPPLPPEFSRQARPDQRERMRNVAPPVPAVPPVAPSRNMMSDPLASGPY